MEILSPQRSSDSRSQPLSHLGFDMLRALVSARQAACPTVQALAQALSSSPPPQDQAITHSMALLSGRMPGALATGTGAFANHSFVGETFANKGESHE